MTDLRVVFVPSDLNGCGHYRCIYPMQALTGHSEQLKLEILEPASEFVVGDWGVIVLQRPTELAVVEETIPFLRSRGWAVVVEIDDNLSRLDPRHFAFGYYHPKNNKNSWKVLERAAEMADMVTVTTPSLARQYGSHGRVQIIPNFIPERYLLPGLPDANEGSQDRVKQLGWAGIPSTHPGDLDVARRGVLEVLKQPDWTFQAIGDPAILPEIGTTNGHVVPWMPIEEYLPALRSLDLGIVPLQGHEFNEGKSWLKGLEYASQGVPFVASPTMPYTELNKLGMGVLAGSRSEWKSTLRMLANDPRMRRELAEVGLEQARGLTVEKNALLWVQAWVEAMKNARSRPITDLRGVELSGPLTVR